MTIVEGQHNFEVFKEKKVGMNPDTKRQLIAIGGFCTLLLIGTVWIMWVTGQQDIQNGYATFKNYEPYIRELQRLNVTIGGQSSVFPIGGFMNTSEILRMKVCG